MSDRTRVTTYLPEQLYDAERVAEIISRIPEQQRAMVHDVNNRFYFGDGSAVDDQRTGENGVGKEKRR